MYNIKLDYDTDIDHWMLIDGSIKKVRIVAEVSGKDKVVYKYWLGIVQYFLSEEKQNDVFECLPSAKAEACKRIMGIEGEK